MATRNINSSPGERSGPTVHSVGIDIGYRTVRAVEVEMSGDQTRLLKRGSAAFDPHIWDDLLNGKDTLAQAIRSALSAGGISASEATAGLPRRLVTLKYARLPHAEPEQIRQMVEYEAQQYIPFPVEDVVLDHQIVSDETEEMTTVMVVAARRTIVEDLMAAFDKAGVEVTRLSVSALALGEHASSSTIPIALLDVEAGELDLAVVTAGRLLFTRAATLSETAATQAGAQRLAGEVARSLTSYQNEYRAQPVSKLLVAGPTSDLPDIEMTLSGLLDVPIARMNGQMLPVTDSDALSYATAVGLALEKGGRGISQINLVPTSRFEQKAAAKRRVQSLAAVAVLVVVLVVGGFFITQSLAAQKMERANAQRENKKLDVANIALKGTKAQHEKVAKNYKTLTAGLGRKYASVDIIKAVSDSVPPNSGIYLSQLIFDRAGVLTIHGNARTESAATDLVNALQGMGTFTQVRLNYLGDAQADNSLVPASATEAVRQKLSSSSFVVICKLPVPVVDIGDKKGAGGTNSSSSTSATSTTTGTGDSP